jgi:hypothetical protein
MVNARDGGITGLLVADVTGDGIEDIIVGAPNAAVDGVLFAGKILIFEGGSLPGSAPIATLRPPAQYLSGARMGATQSLINASSSTAQGILFEGKRPPVSATKALTSI